MLGALLIFKAFLIVRTTAVLFPQRSGNLSHGGDLNFRKEISYLVLVYLAPYMGIYWHIPIITITSSLYGHIASTSVSSTRVSSERYIVSSDSVSSERDI